MDNQKHISSLPVIAHKFTDIQKQISFLFSNRIKKDQITEDKLNDLLQIQLFYFNKLLKTRGKK